MLPSEWGHAGDGAGDTVVALEEVTLGQGIVPCTLLTHLFYHAGWKPSQ